MSKLGRFWDWFLPELICLSPMGAIAYFNTGGEDETSHQESPREERRVFDAPRGSLVIPLARP